jgi:hypothetical protein
MYLSAIRNFWQVPPMFVSKSSLLKEIRLCRYACAVGLDIASSRSEILHRDQKKSIKKIQIVGIFLNYTFLIALNIAAI